MIVVDSSVLIDHLRNRQSRQVAILRRFMQRDRLLIGDIVLVEVLRGLPNEREAASVERALRRFEIVQMLNEALAPQAASHYRALRGRGVTMSKTVDLIIGTYCIANRHFLLHNDRDFIAMAQYLGLRSLGQRLH